MAAKDTFYCIMNWHVVWKTVDPDQLASWLNNGICTNTSCAGLFSCFSGQRSAVGNMSGNRCESGCRSRGREFHPSSILSWRLIMK